MKFPILIHFMNNKANHIVNSVHDLPRGVYFKVVSGQFPVDNEVLEDVTFRRIEPEPQKEITIIDVEAQEDFGSSGFVGKDSGTSSSGEDSSGASL